jgi:Asp-tRNA(Asn)/Glu-tRNA(Gln) amidotransferase B subunit
MLSRTEVIEIRDWVRWFREQRYAYGLIADLFNFQCGIAEAIAFDLDLILSDDTEETDAIIKDVLLQNEKVVSDYQNGKKAAIGSLVGAVKKRASHLDGKRVQERLLLALSQL